MSITRKRLYLEVAPVGKKTIYKIANFFTAWGAPFAPIIVLGNPKDTRSAADRERLLIRLQCFLLLSKFLVDDADVTEHASLAEPVADRAFYLK